MEAGAADYEEGEPDAAADEEAEEEAESSSQEELEMSEYWAARFAATELRRAERAFAPSPPFSPSPFLAGLTRSVAGKRLEREAYRLSEAAPPSPSAAGGGGLDGPPARPCSAVGYALAVLRTPRADAKASLAREGAARWAAGELPPFADGDDAAPPDRPARDPAVAILPPAAAPKRGRGGTPASRVALVHALAHSCAQRVGRAWRGPASVPPSFD